MKQDPEKLDSVGVGPSMPQTLVLRAIEELKTMSQDHEERERYESRRKAQMDYNTGVKVAHMEGEIAGMIHAFERVLNLPETPHEQLVSLSMEDRRRLASDLQARVLKQR